MDELTGKIVLITGAAYRLGKVMALAAARAGADVIVHHGHSAAEAETTAAEIRALGRQAWVLQADLGDAAQVSGLFDSAQRIGPLYALVNSAAIFPSGGLLETSLATWQANLDVNLTAPFMLTQAFIRAHQPGQSGRIINLLDWRALRPGRDHFGYTISKSGLAALTQAAALAAAPEISVNAIALGAILPPSGEEATSDILRNVPAKRWAELGELESTFLFLLTGPAYITGEIIHLDGGRHLV
jgi:Dehydrogenases with different specificities (related to short-chain alcohol dehydrogenases)